NESCQANTTYSVSVPPPRSTPSPTFQVSSPLCAVEGATVADGRFPLFVFDHPNGAEGGDFQRIMQLPLLERLASHGFVVALALHPAGIIEKLVAMESFLDFLLSPDDPLRPSIDDARVGMGGHSAGGGTAMALASGLSVFGFDQDTRVKAFV